MFQHVSFMLNESDTKGHLAELKNINEKKTVIMTNRATRRCKVVGLHYLDSATEIWGQMI